MIGVRGFWIDIEIGNRGDRGERSKLACHEGIVAKGEELRFKAALWEIPVVVDGWFSGD